MRKSGIILVAVVALVMVVSLSWAASIVTSKHDMSTGGGSSTYGGGTSQVCIFCHTPHNALSTIVPLWNHTTTTQTFAMYTSSTLNAVMTGQPGNVSKACLSCHDGTVAVDSYGGATGSHLITGTALLGTDLTNDHPIGFTYDAALATR